MKQVNYDARLNSLLEEMGLTNLTEAIKDLCKSKMNASTDAQSISNWSFGYASYKNLTNDLIEREI